MKILLIGHSVEDHIFYKGVETVKPGGMYYTASGYLNIKDAEDEIFLITSIEQDNYHLFSRVYDKINTDHCVRGKDIVPRGTS
jgi:hypothetical protein